MSPDTKMLSNLVYGYNHIEASPQTDESMRNIYWWQGEAMLAARERYHSAAQASADLVIYDPSFEGTFDVADSLSKTDYSGYQGTRRKGRSETVVLRGRTVVRAGRFVGEAGGGRYLPRTPSH